MRVALVFCEVESAVSVDGRPGCPSCVWQCFRGRGGGADVETAGAWLSVSLDRGDPLGSLDLGGSARRVAGDVGCVPASDL
jgi:hypothetical protein